MGRPCVTRGFLVPVHGLSMSHPWVYNTGSWVAYGSITGSPMSLHFLPWVVHDFMVLSHGLPRGIHMLRVYMLLSHGSRMSLKYPILECGLCCPSIYLILSHYLE